MVFIYAPFSPIAFGFVSFQCCITVNTLIPPFSSVFEGSSFFSIILVVSTAFLCWHFWFFNFSSFSTSLFFFSRFRALSTHLLYIFFFPPPSLYLPHPCLLISFSKFLPPPSCRLLNLQNPQLPVVLLLSLFSGSMFLSVLSFRS